MKSATVPEVAIVSPAQDYTDLDGNLVKAEEMDLCVRSISVGQVHKAYPITGAVGTGSVARIPGTVVCEMIGRQNSDFVRLGHSSGVMAVEIAADGESAEKYRFPQWTLPLRFYMIELRA